MNVGFVVLQGIRTNIAKEPYIFVIFQLGGGSTPPVPPLDWCMVIIVIFCKVYIESHYIIV